MNWNCPHCPRDSAHRATCPGLAAPRVCELTDPSHPAYRPAYLESARSHGLAPPPLRALLRPAIAAAARFARSGFRLADLVEYRRRRAICRACPLLDRERGRCRRCGCLAAAKPWLASESCPDGRW